MTASAFPHLFAPLSIGSLDLRNRTVVAPMTRISATEDGFATAAMAPYYARYVEGGFGLVISEATYIDKAYSQGYFNQPGIADDAQAEAWRPIVEAVHAAGAPMLLQLVHCGALNQGNRWRTGTIAPSVVQPVGEQAARYRGVGPYALPREITRDEMAEVVASFAAAARRAIAVGFDGIEIHGANGYLLDQFLTTYTNQRTDEYGGSLENRLRYHLEVANAVRAAVPSDKLLVMRISQTKVNDLSYSWPGGAEDAATIFGALGTVPGLAIHVSAHLGADPVFGTGTTLAGLAKRASGALVIGNGKMHEPERAEGVLARGEADLVSIGKGALADPAWPAKIAAGRAPIPFVPEMISPVATIANTEAFRQRKAA